MPEPETHFGVKNVRETDGHQRDDPHGADGPGRDGRELKSSAHSTCPWISAISAARVLFGG